MKVIGKKANSVSEIIMYVKMVGARVDVYTKTYWRANGCDNGLNYVGSVEPYADLTALEIVKGGAELDGYTLAD